MFFLFVEMNLLLEVIVDVAVSSHDRLAAGVAAGMPGEEAMYGIISGKHAGAAAGLPAVKII